MTSKEIGAAMDNVDNVIFLNREGQREWRQHDHGHFVVFRPFMPDDALGLSCEHMHVLSFGLVVGFDKLFDCQAK